MASGQPQFLQKLEFTQGVKSFRGACFMASLAISDVGSPRDPWLAQLTLTKVCWLPSPRRRPGEERRDKTSRRQSKNAAIPGDHLSSITEQAEADEWRPSPSQDNSDKGLEPELEDTSGPATSSSAPASSNPVEQWRGLPCLPAHAPGSLPVESSGQHQVQQWAIPRRGSALRLPSEGSCMTHGSCATLVTTSTADHTLAFSASSSEEARKAEQFCYTPSRTIRMGLLTVMFHLRAEVTPRRGSVCCAWHGTLRMLAVAATSLVRLRNGTCNSVWRTYRDWQCSACRALNDNSVNDDCPECAVCGEVASLRLRTESSQSSASSRKDSLPAAKSIRFL